MSLNAIDDIMGYDAENVTVNAPHDHTIMLNSSLGLEGFSKELEGCPDDGPDMEGSPDDDLFTNRSGAVPVGYISLKPFSFHHEKN